MPVNVIVPALLSQVTSLVIAAGFSNVQDSTAVLAVILLSVISIITPFVTAITVTRYRYRMLIPFISSTYPVVAIRVGSSLEIGVGAFGVPVKVGEAIEAFTFISPSTSVSV